MRLETKPSVINPICKRWHCGYRYESGDKQYRHQQEIDDIAEYISPDHSLGLLLANALSSDADTFSYGSASCTHQASWSHQLEEKEVNNTLGRRDSRNKKYSTLKDSCSSQVRNHKIQDLLYEFSSNYRQEPQRTMPTSMFDRLGSLLRNRPPNEMRKNKHQQDPTPRNRQERRSSEMPTCDQHMGFQ